MIIKTVVVFSLLSVGIALANYERRCNNTQFECNNGQCIGKHLWCSDYYGHCDDRSHRINCGLIQPNCSEDQDACHNRVCIPLKWFCDGHRDCPDGSDETECSTDGYRINDKVTMSEEKAKNWLTKQRRINWGWEGHTHRAITAFYLCNANVFSQRYVIGKLMLKQLQIQLSSVLLKGSSIPMHEIALYIHSLLATCLNPRKFQYHDLVDMMKQLMETSDGFNPFVALALCNANSTLSSASISKLIEIMNRPSTPEAIESKAYAAMTLICLKNRGKNFIHDVMQDVNFTGSFTIRNFSDVTSSFKNLQMNNGSFGSLYTTALVMQALQAAGDNGIGWKKLKALQYLTSEQKGDGSFGDGILCTYLILPVLNGKSLVDLGKMECTSGDSNVRNLTVREELDSINSISHKVSYLIWVGLNKEIAFSTTFTVPVNATFHDVMRLAEEVDPRYRFKYIPYSWGNYVYSIFGIPNDPEAGRYWQLFQLKGNHFTPVDKAPDKLITEISGQYVYWFTPTSRFPHNKGDTNKNDSHFVLEAP